MVSKRILGFAAAAFPMLVFVRPAHAASAAEASAAVGDSGFPVFCVSLVLSMLLMFGIFALIRKGSRKK
ncbi:hypothetical protein QWJ34_16495 [Saccharibacillus sp. CPCC 101409]|uniref:hypothetical protein n=1 Tax=Saccharibacillus sp. CPCC 101409 TaxID=3058041 RepID=UPI00267317D5|nr:hypothetical protein [Saccharibacillus sp. CPCC 101409]MDO3411367.1 hypothetical protein [Saccharibacillus sp. CPCC 101409]